MADTRKPRGPKRDNRDNAGDWLGRQLANGPKAADDILSDADAAGFKPWTIRRAFKDLECRRWKSGFNSGWLWALAEDDTEDNSNDQGPVIL